MEDLFAGASHIGKQNQNYVFFTRLQNSYCSSCLLSLSTSWKNWEFTSFPYSLLILLTPLKNWMIRLFTIGGSVLNSINIFRKCLWLGPLLFSCKILKFFDLDAILKPESFEIRMLILLFSCLTSFFSWIASINFADPSFCRLGKSWKKKAKSTKTDVDVCFTCLRVNLWILWFSLISIIEIWGLSSLQRLGSPSSDQTSTLKKKLF